MRAFTIGVIVGIILCWITVLMAIAAFGLNPFWNSLE
jgi:hypothetical protein